MITLKQFDNLRKEVQIATLNVKAPGYGITLGITSDLFHDLTTVLDKVTKKDSIEYYFYNVPVRLIDGDGSRWVLYFATGDIR